MFTAVAAMTALADETIKVSNRTLNLEPYSWSYKSSEFNNCESGGFVSWDVTTRTLTLTDFRCDRENDLSAGSFLTCIEVNTTNAINIELKGSSSLGVGKGQTLVLHGNTTFKGDGYLYIYNRDTQKPAIELDENNITLTIDGPRLNLGGRGIRGNNNTGTLYMKSGTLTSASKALIDMGSFIYSYGMGVQTPKGVYFSNTKHTLVFYENDEPVGNNKVVFGAIKYYGFSVCGNEITENNYEYINKMGFVRSGSVSYNPTSNQMAMTSATVRNNTKYATVVNDRDDGLTIFFTGTNMFTYEGTTERKAMDLRRNTTLWGTTNEQAVLESTADYAGISVADGKKLTVGEVNLDVAYLAGGSATSELALSSNVEITARGFGDIATVRQLRISEKSTSIAVKSTREAPRFIWNREGSATSGVYENTSSLAKGEVTLSTKSSVDWYSLYICGYQVNSLNADNPVNEYIKSGKPTYSKSLNALSLSNANIDYNQDSDKPAILFNSTGFIYLYGTNRINCNYAEAIRATNLYINKGESGEGSLTITGNNAKTVINKQLSIQNPVTITMPELEAGTLIGGGSWLTITRKLEADKCWLYETNTSHDWTLVSTPEQPTYYDRDTKKIVSLKGPVKLVPRSSVTVYPISFCGTEVHSENASCVMNKYVQGGRVEVKKVSNGYQVYLHEVTVNNESSNPVFDFGSIEGAYFYPYGDNNITSATKPFIYGNAKLITVRANSSDEEVNLLVNGNGSSSDAGSIVVPENGKISIYKYVASKFNVSVPCIAGQGTSSTLYVNDPYLTVTGNRYGTVRNIKCELGSNVELFNTPSTPREIRSDGIYANGSLCTEEVRFVKMGESTIPVKSIALDRQELTLDDVGQTYQLTATVLPEDATNKTVTWLSSHPDVATVSDDGLVTALKEGITFIYAYASNNKMAYCKVTVGFAKDGKLGTNGTWTFAGGVLTVDYNGQMPQNCTSKTTDPEIAYRLKWIDFLSSIKEIVITGTDVEVQPYFLYYSGNGDLGQHPDDHIKTIRLSSGVKSIGRQAFAIYDLHDLYCYSLEPPVLSSINGNGNVFWKTRMEANKPWLHLLKDSDARRNYAILNSEWMLFANFLNDLDPEDDPVGIKDLKDSKDFKDLRDSWFMLDGRKLGSKPAKAGLYIQNGKKIVIK